MITRDFLSKQQYVGKQMFRRINSVLYPTEASAVSLDLQLATCTRKYFLGRSKSLFEMNHCRAFGILLMAYTISVMMQ